MDDIVVFYHMRRIKRGYYTYTLIPITEHPKQTEQYEITNAHVKCLEEIIQPRAAVLAMVAPQMEVQARIKTS